MTTGPSSVGATGATLNGTVLPELTSTATFQYGTTTAYGSSTAGQAVGASGTPVAVSAVVTGLAPNTTYHYRILDTQVGTSYGADQTLTTPAVPPVAAGPTPPVVSSASESHRTWREGSALATLARARKRPPVGTAFSFTLNEPATVTLTFTQTVPGRKVKGKCVAQTKANKRKHSCSRTVTRGTLALAGHAGTDKVAFQGRVSRSRKLKPGTYTLTIIASNTAGLRSAPARLTFTIVK